MASEPVETQFGGEVTRMYVSVSPTAQATSIYRRPCIGARGKPPRCGHGGRTGGRPRRGTRIEEHQRPDRCRRDHDHPVAGAGHPVVVRRLPRPGASCRCRRYRSGRRNVSERRTTIGMLRAIGFKQRHVLRMFSIEISWVAVLGMLNGLLVGYGFHVVLYNALWEAEGAAFSFPWASTGSSSPPVGSWCSSPPTFLSAGHRPFHLLQHYVLPEK